MEQVSTDLIVADHDLNIRENVDNESITGLIDSIKEHGFLSPLIVSGPNESGSYHLVCGHRRFVAARKIGMTSVPVVVRNMSNDKIPILQLVENIQRESLLPMEEARAYRRVISDYGINQNTLASMLGISKSLVSQRLKLLEADENVINALESGKITVSDARDIAYLPEDDQKEIVKKASLDKQAPARPAKPQPKKKENNEQKAVVREEIANRKNERPGTKGSNEPLEDRLSKLKEEMLFRFQGEYDIKLTGKEQVIFCNILDFLLKEKKLIVY